MNLEHRVALVTGAGHRVGRAIAEALGARGMRVAVHFHRSEAGARETTERIQSAGGSARSFGADLADAEAPVSLVRAVADAYGGLDVLINSAATMDRTPIGSVTAEAWDRIMSLNLRAPFLCAQAAAGVMRAGQGGAIVNIADLAAFETWRDYIPHGISKAGIVQMTRALAHALAPAVRVNAVAPGVALLPDGWPPASAERLVETTPLKRLGTPADVSAAVLYLLEADFVTGETLIVDGGRHVRR